MPGALTIIGIGSLLREDDGAGQVVVERLRECGVDENRLLALTQLLPEHAEVLATADRVIVIDAARNQPPGRIVRTHTIPSQSPVTQIHSLTLPILLRLAQDLYGRAAPTELVSIGGLNWGLGQQLSAEMTDAIGRFVPELMVEVQAYA